MQRGKGKERKACTSNFLRGDDRASSARETRKKGEGITGAKSRSSLREGGRPPSVK